MNQALFLSELGCGGRTPSSSLHPHLQRPRRMTGSGPDSGGPLFRNVPTRLAATRPPYSSLDFSLPTFSFLGPVRRGTRATPLAGSGSGNKSTPVGSWGWGDKACHGRTGGTYRWRGLGETGLFSRHPQVGGGFVLSGGPEAFTEWLEPAHRWFQGGGRRGGRKHRPPSHEATTKQILSKEGGLSPAFSATFWDPEIRGSFHLSPIPGTVRRLDRDPPTVPGPLLALTFELFPGRSRRVPLAFSA